MLPTRVTINVSLDVICSMFITAVPCLHVVLARSNIRDGDTSTDSKLLHHGGCGNKSRLNGRL